MLNIFLLPGSYWFGEPVLKIKVAKKFGAGPTRDGLAHAFLFSIFSVVLVFAIAIA
jgi:hypothetical protein